MWIEGGGDLLPSLGVMALRASFGPGSRNYARDTGVWNRQLAWPSGEESFFRPAQRDGVIGSDSSRACIDAG